MANIFQKSALDRLSSPDRQDKPLKISSPLSWLALLGATFLIAAVLIWSFTSYLPDTITSVGAVSAKHETNTIFSDVLGRLESYVVKPGDLVQENQVVCWIRAGSGEQVAVRSNQAGLVARTLVAEGEYIDAQNDQSSYAGKGLILLDPDPAIESPQVVVFYVSKNDVGKLRVGMETQVTLTSQKSQTYGHMIGRITNIDTYATTTESLRRLHGSELGLDLNNEPVAVTCELGMCSDKSPTQSGYWWSNEKGGQLPVQNGNKCSVKVIVKKVHPIEKFLTKIKEIWEGK